MTESQIYRLLMRLRAGGALVAAADCSLEEIALAHREGRYASDSDGFGYVYKTTAPAGYAGADVNVSKIRSESGR